MLSVMLSLATSCLVLTPSSVTTYRPVAQLRATTPTLAASAGSGRRAVLLTAVALATTTPRANADTLEEIAARSNAAAEMERAAKAKKKADAAARDAVVNVGASGVLVGLGGFAAYTAYSYISSSNTRYFNLDDRGVERGYAPDEPLFQARGVDNSASTKKKAGLKKIVAKKAAPPKSPAFELPSFGEFGSPAKAAPGPKLKAKAKASAKAAPAAPAFKFPWD